MLDIIDKLSVFFEDCYKEFSVREYSREVGISPPTASKILKNFADKKLLLFREERGFLLFGINRESDLVLGLSRIYWRGKLDDLVSFLNKELYGDAVILFGSLSKLEARKESDVDIVVLSKSKKHVDLAKFEKKLKRVVHVFVFESLEKINKELRNNVMNGCILRGYIK